MAPATQPEPAVTQEGTTGIEVVSLSKRFDGFVAVDSLTFSVAPGQVFALLGPNGAGKSTTVRMLCGIIRPSSGQARVAGYDVVREPDRVKSSIGYMSQKFSLYPELTAKENFNFYAGIYGLGPAQSEQARLEYFARFGLKDYAGVPSDDLPLGYKQRLALACAIAHRPRVLFLDEPTSGVDPDARRYFWDTIQSLAAEGIACLVTTHYIEEAEYADRLALIYQGRLVAVDSPLALKQSYPWKIFQLRGPQPLSALQRLAPSLSPCRLFPYGNSLRLACPFDFDPRPAIETILSHESFTLEPDRPNLEDVFVWLTGQSRGK